MTEQIADAGSNNTDTGSEDAVVDTQLAGDSQEGAVDTGAASDETLLVGDGESDESLRTEGVPETYDFGEAADGELDQEIMAAMTPIFKEAGLTQEQASKLVDAYSEVENGRNGDDTFDARVESWNKSLKEDSDFGGDQFAENSGQVSQFIQATLPDGIKDEFLGVMNDTGLGSHPAVVKYIHALSKKFPTMEDSPSRGQAGGQRPKSTEDRMYPQYVK